MSKQEELLWRLQELKQEELKITQTEEIKAKVGALKGLKEQIVTGEKEQQSLTELIKQTEDEIVELEKESKILAEQIKAKKEKLYAAKGSSLKELLSLQQAIIKSEKQGKDVETKYWELQKKLEEYKKKKAEFQQIIKACRLEFKQGAVEYKKLKAQSEIKLAEIKNKQEEIKEQLLPEIMRMYKEAERRFPYSFVAMLRKDACTGCHIGVSMNLVKRVKEGKALQHCDNCGRILINYRKK